MNTEPNPVQAWPDIMYTAKATPGGYHVDYVIYQIIGLGEDETGNYTIPTYRVANGAGMDHTTELDQAEVFAHGFVRFDGCSNWLIDDMDNGCMMHGCGRDDLTNLGLVLARCWDWTESLIPDAWL